MTVFTFVKLVSMHYFIFIIYLLLQLYMYSWIRKEHWCILILSNL